MRRGEKGSGGNDWLQFLFQPYIKPLETRKNVMQVYGQFPAVRMRRMRRDDFSRRLMREHVLTTDDLIYPVFVVEGRKTTQQVPSMPGVSRHSTDLLLGVAERCVKAGIPAMALFPAIEPSLKTPDGKEAL